MKIACFSIADWCESCQGMPLELEGLFVRLMMKTYARERPLPDDDAFVARLCGVEIRTYRRLKAELLKWRVIEIKGGNIHNRRADLELEDIQERKRKASESGKAGARKRWGKATDEHGCKATLPEVPANIGATSAEDRAEVQPKSGRIADATANKNNDIVIASPSPSPSPNKDSPPTPKGGASDLSLEVLEAFSAYNEIALRLGLPQAAKLTPGRSKYIAARLRDHGIDGWNKALQMLAESPHCLGENDRGWRADLDFLSRPEKFQRVVEGAYRKTSARSPALAAKPNRWWEDPVQIKSKAPTLDAWRSLVTKHANGDWPIYYLGPPPGARGCVVPKEIVEEFDLAGRYDEKGFGIDAVAH